MENGKLKILLCDDEKRYLNDLAEKLREYLRLRELEAEIVTSRCAESILKQDTLFDIAFLDIEMRSLDGIALAKALRQRNARIIIFFVTAFAEYQDDVMDFQAFRFFEKPVEPERLYANLLSWEIFPFSEIFDFILKRLEIIALQTFHLFA